MLSLCFNDLFFPKEKQPVIVEKIIRKNEGGGAILDFELIMPIGDVPNAEDLRLEKWGTKYLDDNVSIGPDCIRFVTDDMPPIPILKKLAELYRDSEFRLEYYHYGVSLNGIVTARWQGGEVVVKEEKNYMSDQAIIDELLRAVPKE